MKITAAKIKMIEGWISTIEQLQAEVSDLAAEIDDAFNDKSEKWQEGEAGEAMRCRIDHLQECDGTFDELKEKLEEAKAD